MRILHVVGVFPCLSETFVANQIADAIRRGHDVWVYAAFGADAGTVAPELAKRVLYGAPLGHGIAARVTTGWPLFTQVMQRNPARAARLVNVLRYGWEAASLKLLQRAAPLVGQERFDVIHCQFGTLAPLVLALRRERILQGPVVVNFRGHDISAVVNEQGTRVYESVFKGADFFVSNCLHFKKRLEFLGCDPSRLTIVYSGIDTDTIIYRLPRETVGRLQLIAIGRLVEKKGLTYAIAAAAILRDRGLAFDFRIVGSGPLEAALRAQVAALGLDDTITFLGGLPQEQVLELLRRSDVMVSPNVTAGDGDEDAPVNTIKEAMAVGVPVVSTWHGGIPELVEDGITGLLARERDVETLALHVLALAHSAELRQRLSMEARSFIEREFGQNLQYRRLMSAYEGAAAHHAKRWPGQGPAQPPAPAVHDTSEAVVAAVKVRPLAVTRPTTSE